MAELFKFRCFQCQKLLGAPASRVGTATTCPRCGIGLVVPPPLGEGPGPGPSGEADEAEVDSIRLEDLGLRLDPEPLSRPAATARPPEVGPSPVAFLETLESEPEAETDAEDDPPALEGPVDELSTPLTPASLRRGRGGASPAGRARDVVLPRTAAIAWSMFALLALASAFAAGLMIGHFLWR